jgi:hypothetical protein
MHRQAGVNRTFLIAAPDDGRSHWSREPWFVCGVGCVLVIAGLAGMTWTESLNWFFEPTVRILADRVTG